MLLVCAVGQVSHVGLCLNGYIFPPSCYSLTHINDTPQHSPHHCDVHSSFCLISCSWSLSWPWHATPYSCVGLSRPWQGQRWRMGTPHANTCDTAQACVTGIPTWLSTSRTRTYCIRDVFYYINLTLCFLPLTYGPWLLGCPSLWHKKPQLAGHDGLAFKCRYQVYATCLANCELVCRVMWS